MVAHVVKLKGLAQARECETLERALWGGEEPANDGTEKPTHYSANLPIQLVQNYGANHPPRFSSAEIPR